jgi:hypothetical protein
MRSDGPSRSGERETERAEIARAIDQALLRRHAGVLGKSKKLRRNVLDGAGFVRDVRNTFSPSISGAPYQAVGYLRDGSRFANRGVWPFPLLDVTRPTSISDPHYCSACSLQYEETTEGCGCLGSFDNGFAIVRR